MDDKIDIEKIEIFLETLKNTPPIESGHIIDLCGEDINEPHEPDIPESTESEVKLEDLQKSLNYNEECHFLLSSLESSLVMLLEECMKEQKLMRENVDVSENKRVGFSKHSRGCYRHCIRKTCTSPYFKDNDSFPCQYNEDFGFRKNLGYLDPWNITRPVAWTDVQKRKLENCIKTINMEREKSHIMVCEKSHVLKNINAVSNAAPESCGKNSCVNEAFGFEKEEYDWIKISVSDLKNAHSPLECCAIWNNYLHPKINKKRWTENESKILKKLVEEYNREDWESIAHNLGTGRSAYQCIGHFKIRLADFSKVKWRQRDFFLLHKFVKMFRVHNFTPWIKISWLMDGRSTDDIYRKWKKGHSDLKKGTFSLEEDVLLVAGLKQFGEDWSQIAQYLPNRDNVQVRGRVMVLKGREVRHGPWTAFEDELIEELVQKYGFGNWAKISTHFLSRNNVQIRTRYKTLRRWKAKQNSDSASIPAPTIFKPIKNERRLDRLWETAQKIVQNKLKIDPHDNKFNVIRELSQILKPQKKRGRKKGTINFPSFQKEFYNIFHVAYSQRGGRGKDVCQEDKIPTLVYQTLLALQLFDAEIVLPTEKELINKDCSILEMDKSVVLFLVDIKESVQDNCKFIRFGGSSCNVKKISSSQEVGLQSFQSDENKRWYPLCSPSGTTLIGLRTMLLNRANIREQSRGSTIQGLNTISTQSKLKTDRYLPACKLWNKRLRMLFTWAAFLSKMYPLDHFITDCTKETNDISSGGLKRKAKNRTRRKKQMNKRAHKNGTNVDTSVQSTDYGNVTIENRPKRAYVKSGKFAMKTKVNGSIRRNTRLTKTDN